MIDYFFHSSNLKRVQPKGSKAKVMLLGKYDPQKINIIEDPYYVSQSILKKFHIVLYNLTFFHDLKKCDLIRSR